jgi:hypothetical protein
MSRRERLEVATLGDPVAAVADALAGSRIDGGVFRVSVHHDETCPCVKSARDLRSCNCEIVWVEREKIR